MSKFGTAWKTFWAIMGGTDYILKSDSDAAITAAAKAAVDAIEPVELPEQEDRFSEGAVYGLLLLQREGRLIDFLQENIESFDDADIGRAVREIHAGCKKVLGDNFGVAPMMDKVEGEKVALTTSIDPSQIRLTGNVPDAPPYNGTLQHKGWQAAKLHFPERTGSYDATVIQAAEVEI